MNLILILFTKMFFNNDSIVVVSAILVLGVFTYTFYNNIFTTVHNTSNTIVYKEVGVQTESLVNTVPCIQPNISPDRFHVDAEVQTKSLWELIKEFINKFLDHNGSDLVRPPTNVRVKNWMSKLDPSQIKPASDEISGSSDSNIQNLVEVSDLIYENSESNLEIITYDIMDYYNYGLTISQSNAIFDHIEVNSIHHYFIIINDLFYSVDPELINCFI